MRAGRLRHRLEIQSGAESQDAHKQTVITWSAEATVWASIEPLSGREQFYAAAAMPEMTHRVTLRYYSTLTPKKRFLFGTRVFNVLAVKHMDERGAETVAECVEVL